jgi:hypothetical protein
LKQKKAKNKTNNPFGEVEFANSSKASYRRRIAAIESGELRQLAPKIFSSNMDDSPESILRRNWKQVLGYLFPGAVISHRTAHEMLPSKEGIIHLTYKYKARKNLPGLTVFLTEGPAHQKDDMPIPGGLYLSSEPRKALENLEKGSSKSARTLSIESLEEWLEALLNARGEKGLNTLRDRAHELVDLGWEEQSKKLDAIIGALLKTRSASLLQSDLAQKRALGVPYDNGRMQLFDTLATELLRRVNPIYEQPPLNSNQHQGFAFFESYFSNFIEGTEFEIDEAKEIIFDGKIPEARPEDGHDILGVYRLVSDYKDFVTTPQDESDFIDLLKQRHHRMMGTRIGIRPGEFKSVVNRAGDTVFVSPDLVLGTLQKGFEYYRGLPKGFARAAFMMFLVSEVHPFNDGNGRIARVMMNAELSAKNEFRILIPIVYREDYMTSLKKLSRQSDPSVYLKMLERASIFSSLLKYQNLDELRSELTRCNAFKESAGNVLILP